MASRSSLFNLDDAIKFLKNLGGGDTEFTFAAFHPDRNIKPTGNMNGTFSEWKDRLMHLNLSGYGIYVTVNRTDLGGRKASNIEGIRAVWQEDDAGFDGALPIDPSIIVNTSPGKRHQYILVKSNKLSVNNSRGKITKEKFDGIQRTLVVNYGSDKWAADITRVLRVPGFYNTKKKLVKKSKKKGNGLGYMVKLAKCIDKRFSWKKIEKAIGYTNGDARGVAAGAVGVSGGIGMGGGKENVREKMNAVLNAEEYYGQLLGLSMNLANGGLNETGIVDTLSSMLYFSLEQNPDQDVEIWEQRLKGLPQMAKSAWDKVRGEEEKEEIDVEADLTKLVGSSLNSGKVGRLDIPPIKWAVKGLLSEGVSILGGRPKVGKSFFVCQLCAGVGGGSVIAGKFEPVKGTALYVSLEDHQRRLHKRFNDMGIAEKKFKVIHEMPVVDVDDPVGGGLNFLRVAKKKWKDLKLVVIDTMVNILPIKGSHVSDYDHFYPVLSKINAVAHELEISVVLVHHLKKESIGGGVANHFDSLLGSVAIQGAVDAMVVMKRDPEQVYGKIHTTSREYMDMNYRMTFRKDEYWKFEKSLPIDSSNKTDLLIYNAIASAGYVDGADGSDGRACVYVGMRRTDIMGMVGKSVSVVDRRLKRAGGCFEVGNGDGSDKLWRVKRLDKKLIESADVDGERDLRIAAGEKLNEEASDKARQKRERRANVRDKLVLMKRSDYGKKRLKK